jgi:hypothetical protein
MSVFSPPQHATASNDEVYAAFADGDALVGDAVLSSVYSTGSGETITVLRSHGVPIAIRSEDLVAFDAHPVIVPGGPCVGCLSGAIGRAGLFVHAVFEDHEVVTLDHTAFVQELAGLGVIA